jgi:hypothetical protein
MIEYAWQAPLSPQCRCVLANCLFRPRNANPVSKGFDRRRGRTRYRGTAENGVANCRLQPGHRQPINFRPVSASGAKLSRAVPRRLRCDPNPEHLFDLLQAAVRGGAEGRAPRRRGFAGGVITTPSDRMPRWVTSHRRRRWSCPRSPRGRLRALKPLRRPASAGAETAAKLTLQLDHSMGAGHNCRHRYVYCADADL